MSRIVRLIILFAIGSLAPLPGHTDPPVTEAASTPVTDPARVSEHYRQVLQRPEFQNAEEVDVNAHLKDVLSQWFLQLGEKYGQFKYATEMSRFASLLLTLMVVLALTGLLYVTVRFFRRRSELDTDVSTGILGQKTFRPPEFYEKEIQEAIRVGDWHGAWLAAWRQFLSRLESRQLVEVDRTRTNREYLAQLRAQALPSSALALLTGMVDAYDQFIYGHKSIGEPDWNLFHQQIDEAGLLLHLEDKGAGSRMKPGAA